MVSGVRVAGLFPGQGSQQLGMGLSFRDTSEHARALFSQADRLLGYSLSTLCFEGPLERLTLTENAQPAILTASCVAFYESNLKLAAAAGHSLGEYSALVAAGVITFEDAVQIVHKRGRYMQEAVPAGEGAMVAVMGSTEEEIQNLIAPIQVGVVEIANLNCPGQTVVAGDTAGVSAFVESAKGLGVKTIPLNVSAPFHCRLMRPAAERLSRDLDSIPFSEPMFPVYANVTAEPIESAESARELLKRQVCGTVRWTDSMTNLLEREQLSHTVEFGAGGVLTKLMKRIASGTTRLEVFDPQSLAQTLAQL